MEWYRWCITLIYIAGLVVSISALRRRRMVAVLGILGFGLHLVPWAVRFGFNTFGTAMLHADTARTAAAAAVLVHTLASILLLFALFHRDSRSMPLKPAPAKAGTLEFGGFVGRLAAALIDGIIVQIVVFLVSVGAGAVIGQFGKEALGLVALYGWSIGIAIPWLYWSVMESSPTQATLGKMAMGLRVTDLAGNRVSLGRATGRHFGKIASALPLFGGYLMQPFTQRRQTLHDLLAGCLVVRPSKIPDGIVPAPTHSPGSI